MLVEDCNRLFSALIKPYLKLDYTTFPPERKDWVIDHFIPVANVCFEIFFSGGQNGGERANYYVSRAFPSTAKKVAAMRGKQICFKCFVRFFMAVLQVHLKCANSETFFTAIECVG